MNIAKGTNVINLATGATGIVRSVWLNRVSGQYVVNVTTGGMMASWNVAVVGYVWKVA
jgi:hypothetical protein